ncbi:MAG: type 2 lanthipeptide synthetase LanM family protein, partial [Pyrinomonadaceae bacterium]
PAQPLPESSERPGSEQFIAAASAVGDKLELLAHCGADDAAWVGLTLVNEKHWSLMPMGAELYAGVSGVALFLAYLGHLTREERYTTLARKAWQTVRRQAGLQKSAPVSISCFNGLSGLIYVETHLNALWGEPDLLAEAEEMVARLRPFIERDEDYDIIGGAAGCLGTLLGLYRHTASASALSAAVLCGEHLCAHSTNAGDGLGWLSRVAPRIPLTGFSHGSAGIAWALLQLAEVTGEARFRRTALAAIEYERGLYSPVAHNWPDLRSSSTQEPTGAGLSAAAHSPQAAPPHVFTSAWCHGAPGIGLARLRSLGQLDDDDATRAEIHAALETTLAEGFGLNHSLCHGDLGNLDFVMQTSVMFPEPEMHARRERLAARVLASIETYGWLCGVPNGVETPGLMTGLAGIGYGLLRLAAPARVPSVLALAPPLSAPSAKPEGETAIA